MRTLALLGLVLTVSCLSGQKAPPEGKVAFPSFEVREIEKKLGVGYAVLLEDLDGDGKKDILIVDTRRVLWYQNPTWKRRPIIEGQTIPDNVCIAAADIDGDGKLDLALGAGWEPGKKNDRGTLQWLRRGKSLDEPWKLFPIGAEPSLHRIRFANLGGGKPTLLVGPLQGRGATGKNNWMDGSPLRLLAYRIPRDPARDRWVPEVVDESLRVMHNFEPVRGLNGEKGPQLLTASYEGVHLLTLRGGKWVKEKIGTGNQETPKGKRGASEIKLGRLKGGKPFIATIEPWHGHQVVVYTPPAVGSGLRAGPGKGLWQRRVLDDQLRWGHAVACVDLDGDGGDELVIGVRDNLSKLPGQRCGVRLYKALDPAGTRWARKLLDEGGVAVEDLACADLDGDGKIDIVAVGRATRNARIYWNRGLK